MQVPEPGAFASALAPADDAAQSSDLGHAPRLRPSQEGIESSLADHRQPRVRARGPVVRGASSADRHPSAAPPSSPEPWRAQRSSSPLAPPRMRPSFPPLRVPTAPGAASPGSAGCRAGLRARRCFSKSAALFAISPPRLLPAASQSWLFGDGAVLGRHRSRDGPLRMADRVGKGGLVFHGGTTVPRRCTAARHFRTPLDSSCPRNAAAWRLLRGALVRVILGSDSPPVTCDLSEAWQNQDAPC